MSRFLIAAMPFTGHVGPLLAVAEALVRRGHDVRVYTGRAFERAVLQTGSHLVPWRSAPDFDEQDLPATFPRLIGSRGIAQLLVDMTDLFIGTAAAQVEDLERERRRGPWDVLVADEASIALGLLAELTGDPWATVTVLPLQLRSPEGPPAGIGLRPGRSVVGRTRDRALRGTVPVLALPLQRPLARQRAAVGLPPSRQAFADALFSPRLILASGAPILDHGRTDRPAELHWIGVLARPSGDPLPPWWGDLAGRRVVVVTQGTQNVDPDDLLRPALEALSGEPVLVVATTGVPGRTVLPFPVAENVRVADRVPFDALLPLASVVITNGGWGGVLRTLAHGVPLVLAGRDLDKPAVAARVAEAGAGIDLRAARPRPAAVLAAQRRIGIDPSYRIAAATVAGELAAAGGADRAALLLEEFAARR